MRRRSAPAPAGRPAERAYAAIRGAILSGALKPGEHLGEEKLAALTGTSRTPVRDALTRLVGEGLARLVNRHRYVSDFAFDEVVVIFDVRARLEAYAASRAAERITTDELGQLEEIVGNIDAIEAQAPDAVDTFRRLNAPFHRTIIAAARSVQLQNLIAPTVALPLESIKRGIWDQPIDIARSNAQHREIVAALGRRDAAWAAAAMRNHILSTKPYLSEDVAASMDLTDGSK